MLGWGLLVPELLSEVQRILTDELHEWKAEKDAGYQNRRYKRQQQAMPCHSLLTVTLVNRHWNRVGTRNLYSSLYLHKLETIQPLMKALSTNPALVEHVKCLSIDFKYLSLPTQKKAKGKEEQRRKKVSKLVWSLLRLFRSGELRHLSIVGPALHPLPAGVDCSTPPACLIGLKGLDVNGFQGYEVCGYRDFDFVPWVEAAAPSLERLKLSDELCATPKVRAFSFPNLKSFCKPAFINLDGAVPNCIQNVGSPVVRGSVLALVDLSMGGLELPGEVIHRILFRSTTTLKRLHLHPQGYLLQLFDERVSPLSTLWDKLVDVLPICSALEVLELGLGYPTNYDAARGVPFEEPEVKGKIFNIVDALPSNLVNFMLSAGVSSSRENITAISHRLLERELTSLRTVGLPLEYLTQSRRYRNPAEIATELAPLEQLFAARGIVARFDAEFSAQLPWIFRD
ncbi:hypothetical protein BKA62DRAFT_230452 [Auriculariales sp. MPI-PUGE-AT-0066]|nr:hypothetical protein BKA62DRAFT_230452 [Auriculariales sp. MPI-PUGE-AT-0066]